MPSNAALFGRSTLAPVPRNLVQIKAGKMNLKADNWVTSDPRKGLAYMYQTHDGQLHFCWVDRRTGFVEENYVIEPKQTIFKQVSQCTNGRVYCLKLKSNKRLFLWMQERYPSCDEDFCSKVNKYINDPPCVSDYFGNIPGVHSLTQSDLMAILTNGGLTADSDISSLQATQSTVNRPLNTAAAGQSANALGTDKKKQKKIQLQDLRNIVNSIKISDQGEEQLTNFARSKIDLNDAINVTELKNTIEDPEIQNRLKEHLPAVPEGSSTSNKPAEELKASLKSSQFKSTLKSFSSALSMKELTPLIMQFNLGETVNDAAKSGDMVKFAKALQEKYGTTPSTSGTTSDSKKNESESKDKPEPMEKD